MLQLFNIVLFYCFISTTYAMQSDQNAFADHMIAKWKNKGLTFFDPFVLQEQDWLRSDTNLEAIGYLSLRHKTYFQNATLRNFFIKTCKQNPQEAEILRERFTEYQTHLATRLSQLESKKLITAQQAQEINKFVTSTLGILHEASVWNDGPFMQGIISAFWEKEPDIINFDLFTLNKYLMLEHDLDAITVLLNRNKRYLKNNVIRTYLIKRCQMNLESTQKIKDNFLKYQTHMEKRLQELYDQGSITQEDLAAIKEYISSVLTICDTALQKKQTTPDTSRINPLRYSMPWKTIIVCAIAALGIAYYFHTHAKAPQESTTK